MAWHDKRPEDFKPTRMKNHLKFPGKQEYPPNTEITCIHGPCPGLMFQPQIYKLQRTVTPFFQFMITANDCLYGIENEPPNGIQDASKGAMK
jgi:hypothetical protein